MKKFCDRKFKLFFEDAAFLIDEAKRIDDENHRRRYEGVFSRSVIINSALLLEAASNALIDTMGISGKYFNDIDKLTVISKFEYYLKIMHKEKKFDRGSLHVQKIQELVGIRNSIVHPKPFYRNWEKIDEQKSIIDFGETKLLKIPNSFVVLKIDDALNVFKASLSFLNYYFLTLCCYSTEKVRSILTTDSELVSVEIANTHSNCWIEWSDKWGLELNFLVDIKKIKEQVAEAKAGLKAQGLWDELCDWSKNTNK